MFIQQHLQMIKDVYFPILLSVALTLIICHCEIDITPKR